MDAEETTTTKRRISIRAKLLVGFAVPIVFVALLSGVQARNAQADLDRTNEEVTLALAAGGPASYITALLDERNISALDLLGSTQAVELARVQSVAEARAETDKAQAAFAKSLDRDGAEVERLYRPTFEAAAKGLVDARKSFDAYGGEKSLYDVAAQEAASDVYDTYSTFIADYDRTNARAVRQIDDAQLRNRAESIAEQTQSSNMLSLLSRSAAQQILNQGPLRPRERHLAAEYEQTLYQSRDRAIENLRDDPAAFKVMAGFYLRQPILDLGDAADLLVTRGYVGADPTDIPAVLQVMKNAANVDFPNGTDAWQAATKSLSKRADALTDQARSTRNLYVAIFFIATLVSLAFALVIARSIALPLLSISSQARRMADHDLPDAVGGVLATPIGEDIVEPHLEPISINSRDEVADVATSINIVQQRALDLAIEQAVQRKNFADSFLNLGRRMQGLVVRQLDFITELEDDEEDPDTLANLFKLDHLATRIRRNAESLVVLAGVTRRQRRGGPVPVIDALRSALAEVDEYTRVDITDVDDARLPMGISADIAHILAELIENGLNFSPPDAVVQVSGRRTEAGYEITVTDHGIGMSAEQVATANRRLSGNESFTVTPSRYMGHYVAGHLATGLGVEVAVASGGKGAGTTATVLVGSDLLARDFAPQPIIRPSAGENARYEGPRASTTGETTEGDLPVRRSTLSSPPGGGADEPDW